MNPANPQKPWQFYKVGKPSETGFSSDCRSFDSVSHTSHLDSALKIVEDKKIRAGLVFDESILNKKRILVSWLSPNIWTIGYRYGNIKFEFDFHDVTEGKNFYWVEVIPYSIPALRILITDNDYSGDATLIPYNPEDGDGPWWWDKKSKTHYYNGNHCLEFMLEFDVNLSSLRNIEFVKHHDQYCSVHRYDPASCRSRGSAGWIEGGMFLGRLASEEKTLSNKLSQLVRGNGKATNSLEFSYYAYYQRVGKHVVFSGTIKQKTSAAASLARAICALFSLRQFDDAKELARMFESESDFEHSIAEAIGNAAELKDWPSLI